ncbi:hypothetical protein B0H17DRAFT_1203174 [Mycena rosella]|uniref:DUF6534 domain-containing protein n=1 Tax=Mycena rosella TaxID=1033263 RepID=A0AAD7GCJ4_MYCRO|nr:hypothetical protein B0H17DRAFT_1203174 [Mycena rosella]
MGVMVLADTACTLATCAEVNLSLIAFRDDRSSVELLKPLPVVIVSTYTTALVEQFFLCKLYFLLTGNTFVSVLLAIAVLTHTGLSFASATLLLDAQAVKVADLTTIIGATSCAATDIVIASCLSFKFWQMMSFTLVEGSTRSMVRRIAILTISSGAVVASSTLIMVILLFNLSPVFQVFLTCQGRVYALTLLGNFFVGTPNAPSINIDTNPDGSIGTTLCFQVANPDAGSSPLPRREITSSVMGIDDNSSNYYEESIGLKQIPPLIQKTPLSV